MAEFLPVGLLELADQAPAYGFLVQKPIVWLSIPEAWHAEANTTEDSGSYSPVSKTLRGAGVPKRQDTYLQGTVGRTGRAFDVVAGTWKDDSFSNLGTYRLLMPDGAAHLSGDTPPEIVSHDTTPRIENAEIVLRRGLPPVGGDQVSQYQATSNYVYLHFAYGADTDYRMVYAYGVPIRLDYTNDGGDTWKTVHTASAADTTERYLKTHNFTIRQKIEADYDTGVFTVKIGEEDTLRHKPDPTEQPNDLLLPNPGNLRLISLNGWETFEYYPMRYGDISVTKSPRNFRVPLLGGDGNVIVNALGGVPDDQTVTSDITSDGESVSYNLTASRDDAGDGLGSADPPFFSDAAYVLPAFWTDTLDGNPFPGVSVLPVMQVTEKDVFDQISRTRAFSAVVTCNNYTSYLSGSYGCIAANLSAAVDGATFYQRAQCVAGGDETGVEFFRSDPTRLMRLPLQDRSLVMQVPLGQEVILDGWCLFSAVLFLATLGNIAPPFLQDIPFYVPPNTTSDNPFGPAGDDCPYPILPRGTGLNARLKFGPETLVWSVLQLLVQESSDIDLFTGLPVPYVMGFDPFGNFHFEPVSFYQNAAFGLATAIYSDSDVTGVGMIEWLRVLNSVSEMRTTLDFEGLDALTNELLYYHMPMPVEVWQAKGYRFDWMERNARYASEEYLEYITNAAAVQASLPLQRIVFKAPFNPAVHAGDVIVVSEALTLGRTDYFVVEEMTSMYGMADVTGHNATAESWSVIQARALVNTL